MTVNKQQLNLAHVLVVGDVMLDRYWYGAVDRISPEAPVPVVRITREENRLGGCANVAYNVVSLGGKASLLSVVGDDEAGGDAVAGVQRLQQLPRLGAGRGAHVEHAVVRLHVQEERRHHGHRLLPG